MSNKKTRITTPENAFRQIIIKNILDITWITIQFYATVISHKTGKAILIHAACSGDWTRAMLIPEEDFHYNSLCEVTEALE